MRRLFLLALSTGLGGCASFQAATDFGTETVAMTGTVRTEFLQLAVLCEQQAGLVLVASGIVDDHVATGCDDFERAEGRLARATLTVLDGYAQALKAIASDSAFSVSPGVRSIGSQLADLRSASGSAVVAEGDAKALASVAGVLVDLAATARREEAVRQLVAATPALAASGRLLRGFFVTTDGVTAPGARPPYANLVAIVDAETDSAERLLSSRPLREAEPIRSTELLRGLQPTRRLLALRDPARAGGVPAKIGVAIDTWLRALDRFHHDALRPDAAEWIAISATLHADVQAARDAVDALR